MQPRDGQSKDGEERGVRERRYCVSVPWGRGVTAENKVNAVELQEAAESQDWGRGRAWGRTPGGRRVSSSLIQRPLWVPSKPSHSRAPIAQYSDPRH